MTFCSDDPTTQDDFACTPLLDTINGPADLKALAEEDLPTLADEIRRKIISTVASNGGHLASPLGAVELAIALHYVFDTEKDLVIWDVGHQCYAHKLLTGRRDVFDTLRKKDGISGFPERDESPYDSFGVGHSSTSISAALGMAIARDKLGEDRRVIALIGDGAMTGGMAFEALSNAGHSGTDLLVILNDNEMSISKNVGALSAYFSRIITGGLYNRAKEDVQNFVKRALGSYLSRTAQRLERSVKNFLTPGGLFQDLGFKYVGPVEGHDLPTLIDCMSNLQKLKGPVLFHCVTQKGKGYTYAEADPQKYHGVNRYDVKTGEFEGEALPSDVQRHTPSSKTFTSWFADAVVEAARKDERIVAITAAMPTGTGLNKFEEQFPDRFFDVGICEQHAVTFAAGLAAQGLRPVCAIYSTFLQRGYDQVVHDVCLQGLPVVFALDRAGLVGEDSPTHSGQFDLSYFRAIPGVTVLAPRDGVDLREMLHWALEQPGPVAIRYPKGTAPVIGGIDRLDALRGEILREGSDLTLLATGPVVAACLQAAEVLGAEGHSVRVADARCVKPLDTELLDGLVSTPIITVEENALAGGFGAAVMEYFEQVGRLDELRIRRVGFPDEYIPQATREQQLASLAFDAEGIAATVREFLPQRLRQIIGLA